MRLAWRLEGAGRRGPALLARRGPRCRMGASIIVGASGPSSQDIAAKGTEEWQAQAAAETPAAAALSKPQESRLLRFLQEHGIQATLPASAAASTAVGARAAGAGAQMGGHGEACHVKSLVFLAREAPMVVVLPLERRVDRRLLAAALGVRPSEVGLAPRDQLRQLCGYPMGSVPPLGHQPRLPVLVDGSVAQYALCLSGGSNGSGMEERESCPLCLPVAEVLRITGAVVADVSGSGSSVSCRDSRVSGSDDNAASASNGSSGLPGSSSAASASNGSTATNGIRSREAGMEEWEQWEAGSGPGRVALAIHGEHAEEAEGQQQGQQQGKQQGQGIRAEGALMELPLPWAPGSQLVALEGLIAQKRRIARLLGFANLVPAPVEGDLMPHIPPGSGNYLRRLWRCPESAGEGERAGGSGACEVQLILGKTLAERLGRDAAADLIRSLKVGQVVRIVGRPQPHASAPHGTRRNDVLDVVVQELQVLPSWTPPAAPSSQSAAAAAAALPLAGSAARLAQVGAAVSSQGAGSREGRGSRAAYLRLPSAVKQRLVVVNNEKGLRLLDEALFGAGEDSNTAFSAASEAASAFGAAAAGKGPSAGAAAPAFDSLGYPLEFRAVVGMDCEWQPYTRGELHTPVALLQLAVRRVGRQAQAQAQALRQQKEGGAPQAHGGNLQGRQQQEEEEEVSSEEQQQVFLLDLLALLPSLRGTAATHGELHASGNTPAAPEASVVAHGGPGARLSSLLHRLFEDPGLVKVGFRLSHDLQRLCESYSHLPCFGSQGPVPFRSHVDILHLAQAVLIALSPQSTKRWRAGVGLSTICELVLGQRLDKSEQCSDWSSRPLSTAQQAYAATDAYALVALFDELLAQQRRQQARRRLLGGLLPLSRAWWALMAAGVTDVSAFRPTEGSSAVATAAEAEAELPASPQLRGSRRSLADARRAMGISSTLGMLCNVEHLLQRYLGQELPEGGKGAAVRAGTADSTGCEPRRTPRFPRSSGVLEWPNAFMLFVNLQPPDGPLQLPPRYDNRFLWWPQQRQGEREGQVQEGPGGQEQLCITWWPGRGRTLEHPVMRRMLGAGGSSSNGFSSVGAEEGLMGAVEGDHATTLSQVSAGAAGTLEVQSEGSMPGGQSARQEQQPQQEAERQQPPAVLLFCRAPGGRFVFCGRVRPVLAHGARGDCSGGGDGACITWQLVDSQQLCRSPAFLGLLALQGLAG